MFDGSTTSSKPTPGTDALQPMFGLFLNALVGAIVWTLANVVYYDLKRRGVRNFGRFAAFWVGNPTTWITFFVVRERRNPTFEAAPDDDETLLREIRMDRALRVDTDDRQPGAGDGAGEDRS